MQSLRNSEELEMYTFLLEDLYEEVLSNNQLVDLLKKEFNISTSLEELERLQNPTLEEEDIRLIYKHVEG